LIPLPIGCFKLEIFDGGKIFADANDKDCSNPQFDTSQPLSDYDGTVDGNKATFAGKWTGDLFVVQGDTESSEISTLSVGTRHFQFLQILTKCVAAPSMSPSSLPTGVPSVSSIPSKFPTRQPSSTPSSIPSLTPSVLPTNINSSLPSLYPSVSPSSTCPYNGFLGRTLKSVIYDQCWIFDLPTGKFKIDPTDSTCSKTTPGSTAYDLSQYERGVSNRIFFKKIPGLTSYKGYIQIIEDVELTQESLTLTNLDLNTDEFVFMLQVPDCPSSAPFISSEPSSEPSSKPSSKPSLEPSSQPSSVPSSAPSSDPSSKPSAVPSSQPSSVPSFAPSSDPSSKPSAVPSSQPSSVPSFAPSSDPSSKPSLEPSSQPSSVPSSAPSSDPSSKPSAVPSSQPSSVPSSAPSSDPSSKPSAVPSSQPSSPREHSSEYPSEHPSKYPSSKPSSMPFIPVSSIRKFFPDIPSDGHFELISEVPLNVGAADDFIIPMNLQSIKKGETNTAASFLIFNEHLIFNSNNFVIEDDFHGSGSIESTKDTPSTYDIDSDNDLFDFTITHVDGSFTYAINDQVVTGPMTMDVSNPLTSMALRPWSGDWRVFNWEIKHYDKSE
jgi:hypothetical protein